MGFEIVGAPLHSETDLHVHGAFGNAELSGDFLMGESVNFPKFEHLAAPEWQSFDGSGQKLKLLIPTNVLGYTRPIFNDVGGIIFNYAIRHLRTPPPENIEGNIPRHREQKPPRRLQAPVEAGTHDLQIGLLHHIVHIGERGKLPAKVCPEDGLVRQDFLGKPTIGFGVERGHSGETRL